MKWQKKKKTLKKAIKETKKKIRRGWYIKEGPKIHDFKPKQINNYRRLSLKDFFLLVHTTYQWAFDSVVVQLLSDVWLFATPWTTACQASLSFTISQSSLKPISIESGMPSCHLVHCCPLLLLPSVFPSIRVVWFSRISKLFIAPLFFLFFSVFKSIVLYHLFFYFQAFYSRDLWQWFLL